MKQLRRHLATGLAAVLVFLALAVPDQIFRLPPGNYWHTALVRVPIEAAVLLAVVLLLPERARRIAGPTLGALLGLLTAVKLIDIGFLTVLARRFNPVLDWVLFDDGFHFLGDSIGRPATVGIAVGAALLIAASIPTMIWAVTRLTRVVAEHRRIGWGGAGVVATAWVTLTAQSFQLIGGIPVASHAAVELAGDTVLAVPRDLADQRAFAREARVDAYRDRASDRMLTALRGHDVVFAVVESYGRDATDYPVVSRTLAEGDRKLAAAGFAARSGWLTSPTAGGGSWLAHATFHSGLWINNERRYRSLVNSDRLSLTRAFGQVGHRVVGVEPGITYAWPEGRYYGYDQVYDSRTLGYRGPAFSWSPMPDQYVLSAFHQLEYAKPGRGRLVAEVTLTSSHTPWTPVPPMLDWDEIGDGAVYGPLIKDAEDPKSVWQDSARIRSEYDRSVGYSVDSVVSYVQRHGRDDLVVVLFGDHQPAPVAIGAAATRDVPVTLIAKDPKTLDRITPWGWSAGLKPAADAPVWRMDAFRDKFFATFGPEGDRH